jgi:serine/threonine-protein kinase HipA
MTVASVMLWGRQIGAVSWDEERAVANFEYEPSFAASAIEIAPIVMPLSSQIYSFPNLARNSFHGLPGLLADSLPDRFGHALIDAWLARQGRSPENFNPVERLCYIGRRGMGALEFEPTLGPSPAKSEKLQVDALVELASEILTDRLALHGSLASKAREKALRDIVRVGTSAGGARAKAIIAWNKKTSEIRSGQVTAGQGFTYWLLKFDGVAGNRDRELDDPVGYGLIEYAYFLMAREAGIMMSECELLQEHGRNHFLTRRFDRTDDGHKIHMQSLAGLAHFDFNLAGAYSYEEALRVMRHLDLPMASIEEMFRRLAFNVIARNQDDHVKNIAFLMDQAGTWSLSPAFDMTYAYNPRGDWTGLHQMTLNGKRDSFVIEDFEACAKNASMKRGRAGEIVVEVQTAVKHWMRFAAMAGVADETANRIAKTHRTELVK